MPMILPLPTPLLCSFVGCRIWVVCLTYPKMFAKSAFAAAAVFGVSLVEAHQYMVQPVPYDFSLDSFSNSPLLADGSDFPCRASSYSVVEENVMEIGEPQELAFVGTATHGGGSCQISITRDRAPTKDTKWSVIKSIEGGCVADVSGNLAGSNAKTPNPYHFNFTIPDDVEPGKYTLAYTWINRIGVREMYMDCAPITVTGGSASKRSETGVTKRSLDNYPDMFIANINGCKTEEGKDIRFPCPGDTVEYLGDPTNLLPESAPICSLGSPSWGTSGYSCSSGSGSGSGSGSTPDQPSTSTPAEEPSVSVGIDAGVAVPDLTPAPTQPSEPTQTSDPVVVPTTTETVAPAPTSDSAPTSDPAPSAPSSSGTLSGPCTEEGIWNCIDGSSFQRCASGTWTPSQAMAAGTECTPGQSADFTVKAAPIKSRMLKEKRSHRRSHGAHARVHS
ncbi:hypothetical protein BJX61DRAFT_536749 [Aspergillus egyptiacus]|nr:hypothetical protein BJX61DRAFT_536749 [Aspergillus egyptiacus]